MVPLDAFSIGMFSTLVFCQHGYSAYDVCIHNFADGVNFCRNFYLRFFFLRIVDKPQKSPITRVSSGSLGINLLLCGNQSKKAVH